MGLVSPPNLSAHSPTPPRQKPHRNKPGHKGGLNVLEHFTSSKVYARLRVSSDDFILRCRQDSESVAVNGTR